VINSGVSKNLILDTPDLIPFDPFFYPKKYAENAIFTEVCKKKG